MDSPPSWITNAVIDGVFSLSLGDQNAGNMNYQVSVSSAYGGRTDITQLVNRDASNGSLIQSGTSTSGQFWLDNIQFYVNRSSGPGGGLPVTTNSPRQLLFYDGPSFPLLASIFNDTTSIADQFEDFIVFRPDAGNAASNIYVTLGVIGGGQTNSWSWSGSSTYFNFQWSAPTGAITRPTAPSNSDAFPQWTNTYINP
jgi:hypothetical protein